MIFCIPQISLFTKSLLTAKTRDFLCFVSYLITLPSLKLWNKCFHVYFISSVLFVLFSILAFAQTATDGTIKFLGIPVDGTKAEMKNKLTSKGFTYIPKEEDDLTPVLRENLSLEDLEKTWMARLGDDCIFISAKNKENIDALRALLYERIKAIHIQRYPYNDFLFQNYEEISWKLNV